MRESRVFAVKKHKVHQKILKKTTPPPPKKKEIINTTKSLIFKVILVEF